MTSADLLSLAQIRQLIADMGGDQGFMPELVDSLANDINRSLQEMRGAVEFGDSERLRRAAHRLKSSCATFGAMAATRLCQELETIGNSNEIAVAAPMIERLAGICAQTLKALSELSL
jgi:HPt (histidine-containing phosphotransfer) domain-containing protein